VAVILDNWQVNGHNVEQGLSTDHMDRILFITYSGPDEKDFQFWKKIIQDLNLPDHP
jgi:hypothetical protein